MYSSWIKPIIFLKNNEKHFICLGLSPIKPCKWNQCLFSHHTTKTDIMLIRRLILWANRVLHEQQVIQEVTPRPWVDDPVGHLGQSTVRNPAGHKTMPPTYATTYSLTQRSQQASRNQRSISHASPSAFENYNNNTLFHAIYSANWFLVDLLALRKQNSYYHNRFSCG